MKIAKYAQDVVQVGHENLLDYGILRSPIEKANTNLVEGQLIKIDKNHHSCEDALEAALLEIPYGKYALIFVDDRDMLEASKDNLKRAFSSRQEPLIFEGIEEKLELRKWLSEPSKRECDECIVGAQHQSNGIETELVIHVYPADCPLCQISNADPVIISRAKGMLVVATYQRIQCSCGWSNPNVMFRISQINENHSNFEGTKLINNIEFSIDPMLNQPLHTKKASIRYTIKYIKLGLK